MKKKILFRVEGNKSIGMGHFFRCIALAKMLRDDFQISFAISEVDMSITNILENENFYLYGLPELSYNKFSDNFTNSIEFDLTDGISEFEVAVLDGYGFDIEFQKKIAQHGTKCAVIEDFGRGTYFADLIINHAPGLEVKNYNILKDKCLYAIGPDFAMLRPEFLESARLERHQYAKVNDVFICFGASEWSVFSVEVAKLILKETNFRVHVVGFSSEQDLDYGQLKLIYTNRLQLYNELNASLMLDVMNKCQLAIVPASGLLFECLSTNINIISGFLTENQLMIYNGFKELGAFTDAGNFQLEKLKDVILNFSPVGNKKIIDGLSSERFRKLFKKLFN